jgi:hypothetical protein
LCEPLNRPVCRAFPARAPSIALFGLADEVRWLAVAVLLWPLILVGVDVELK